jgi:hypothetical protein
MFYSLLSWKFSQGKDSQSLDLQMLSLSTKVKFEVWINIESYTFAGTSARRYRIVDGQKFQINKMQASLRT